MIEQFQAPIPGQSLTEAPGSRPWERPPEISDPEEAVQMYLTKLSNKKVMESMLDMLELDTSVRMLTEGILRSGVANGIHSIDVSMVVAPVIHEFIKQTADAAGVEYEEGLVDKEQEAERRKAVEKAKSRKWAKKQIEKYKAEKDNPIPSPEEEPMVEEMPMEEPKGFMKRRGEM